MALCKLIRKQAFGGLVFGDNAISENIFDNVSELAGGADSLKGMGAGIVSSVAPYFIPYVGTALAADDTVTQAKRMWDNRGKNTIGDLAELGMDALGMIPIFGGFSKSAKTAFHLAPALGGLTSYIIPGTARENALKKSGKTAVTKKPQEKKFNHYGKMMTAAEIKADNTKRALMKKMQAANKAKMEAMLKAILAKLLAAQQITLQQTPQEQAYQAFDYGAYNIPDYEG